MGCLMEIQQRLRVSMIRPEQRWPIFHMSVWGWDVDPLASHLILGGGRGGRGS